MDHQDQDRASLQLCPLSNQAWLFGIVCRLDCHLAENVGLTISLEQQSVSCWTATTETFDSLQQKTIRAAAPQSAHPPHSSGHMV